MRKKARFWKGVLIVLVITGALLFAFSYSLLFAFQSMRLGQLGCSVDKRQIADSGIAHLQGCQKLWVHRVNSFERLQVVQDHFGGFECDLLFDPAAQTFRITHPPAPANDLTADDYFRWLKSSGKKMWLDVKDFRPADVEAGVRYFLHSDSLYHIRDQVVVESSEPALVNMLAAEGFIVSYLVPPQFLEGNSRDTVVSLLPEVAFVSQEDRFVAALKRRYPQKKIITWALSFDNYFNLSHFRSLLSDPAVAIILINIKSRHYK
ncbi:MAG: hypothetical protein DI539_27185 [Flavobacterium psychrophilum]|nr:MAG: hypothetical protein DI539_27185 [Flavobacterium psychrophilum]